MGTRYALRDDQWDRMQDLVTGRAESVGVAAKDSRLFVETVIHRYRAGIQVVIPPKSSRIVQRNYDEELYKIRHLIENFFAKLKQYRAIATGYDKRASTFLGAIHLAATITWLN